MARFNPYQNSAATDISNSMNSIAKALIGSADTDAALARARASDALAGYRNSQTNYQNQLSDYLGANTQAIADVLADNDQVRQLYEAFGLKSNIGQSIPDGSVGDMIAPNDVTPAATDGMRGLVRSMLFGGVPGNPQQSAAAGQTLADMINQQEAYRLLSQSGQSSDRQAAIRLGQTLGEYFDFGSKQNEINADLAAALNEDKLRFAPGGQGDRDTAATNTTNIELENIKATSEEKKTGITSKAEIEWQNYKTDISLESDQYQADKKLEAENYKTDKTFELGQSELADKKALETKKIETEDDRERFKIAEGFAFEKWKVENETLEMVVEPGKQIVLSPKAGERLGLSPNDQGLYILDGGPKRDSVTIKVGDDDVYLTKEQAEAIGIKPNAEGIYMIPGKAKAGSKSVKFGSSDQKQVQAVAKQTMEDLGIDLAPRVQTAIMAALEEEAAKRFQESNNINSATGYVVSKLNEQFNGQVVVSLDDRAMLNPKRMYQDGLNVPAFVMNEIQGIMATATDEAKGRKAKDDANQKLQKYGFTAPEILKILNSFR